MIDRRTLLYVVALTTVATVVLGLVDRLGLAIAALAVATVSMFGWVVFWARALNARLARITAEAEQVEELRAVIGSLDARLDSTRQQLVRRADAHEDKLGRLRRDVYGVHVAVQRTPSVTTELGRV